MKNRFPMSRMVFVLVVEPQMVYILSKECSKSLTARNNHSSYCSSISPLLLITSLENGCSILLAYASSTKEHLSLSRFLRLFITKHRFLTKDLHLLHRQGFDKAVQKAHFYLIYTSTLSCVHSWSKVRIIKILNFSHTSTG